MNHKHYPLRVLFWEATLRCNAYCAFCGSRCGDVPCTEELSQQEICQVLKQIADRLDASQIMLNVTGGEPLLRKDLTEIMQYAVSLGYHWGLVTNGMLLDAACIAGLQKAGLKTISVSIDGLHDTHDSLRGVQGGLAAVIRNLHLIAEAGFLEAVMITTVVSQRNIGELEQIKKLLKTLPVDVWRICPVDPIGRAADNRELCLTREQMRRVYDDIAKLRQERLPFQVTTSCSHYLGSYEFRTRAFPFQCHAGRTTGSILANGDIFVCPNVPRLPALLQGNVRTHDFVDVWNEGFAFFRDHESRHVGRCSGCAYYASCKADSLHTWDFTRSQPDFCMMDYAMMPPSVADTCETRALSSVIQEIKGQQEKLSDAMVKAQSLSKDIVVITPDAVRCIFDHFAWGTAEPSVEKLCALMGHIYRNPETEEEAFIVCVETVLCLDTPAATDNTLVIDRHIEKQVAAHAAAGGHSLLHVGYMHSHPNDLEIAMSAGDFTWHRYLYEDDWRKALTIILNPQKQHIAAYTGPAAGHTELHLLGYREILENHTQIKKMI